MCGVLAGENYKSARGGETVFWTWWRRWSNCSLGRIYIFLLLLQKASGNVATQWCIGDHSTIPTSLCEGDSLMVVRAITAKEPSCHRYGQIVEDIKLVLRSLRQWTICHVNREVNYPAHGLAKEGSRKFTDSIWIEEISNWISIIVILEQCALSL